MRSHNLNYMYNVEYFHEIFGENGESIDRLNDDLVGQEVDFGDQLEAISEIAGFCSFDLCTTYPGLLLGTGYPHGISEQGAVKSGLSLDYVTGTPYLPGSSLKGALRSWFPDDMTDDLETAAEKTELIRSFLGNDVTADIPALRDWIFENNVVFFGGYPVPRSAGEPLVPLAMDYLTPHNKGKFKNPIPINIMKIRQGIRFRFCFAISDYSEHITADRIKELFRQIILFAGVGAKTSTGYGRFVVGDNIIGTCPNCGADVLWGDDGAPHCSNNCGLTMGKIRKATATKQQMRDFLAGKTVTIVNSKNGWPEKYRKGDVKQIRAHGDTLLIIDAVRV